MTRAGLSVAGAGLCLLAGSYFAFAQTPAPATGAPHPMNFFITSVGMPGGANLHGLAGANAKPTEVSTQAASIPCVPNILQPKQIRVHPGLRNCGVARRAEFAPTSSCKRFRDYE